MAVATSTRPTDVGLRREMGFIGATWASVTSIIGSGWLFGSWKGAYSTGTSAILAWIIGGACIIVLALVHAELGGMYPVSGGTARFPHFAFGSVGGISFGFFSWVQAITVAPIECFAVMQYLSYYWHGVFNADTGNVTALGTWLSILLMASFTAINFLAMRLFTRVNSAITWWKVIIPVITIVLLLFHFHGGNFNSHGGFLPLGTKAMFAAIPGAGMIFAYLGFEQADQLAGEIKDPSRNLPRAIITAILLCTAIYVMLQIVFIGALHPSTLNGGWAGLANNTGLISGPLAFVAGAAGLGWWAVILRIDAFVSPFGTVLMYAGAPLSLGAFRRRLPDADRPYKVPAGSVVSPLAFVIAGLIMYWSGLEVIWKLGVVLLIGYVVIGIAMAFDPQRPPLDWKSAQWLPVYLVGMGILSWQGQFSGGAVAAPVNTNNIPFWWDMLIVAVFCLVIYYWAMATSLPREEMVNLIDRQAEHS